MKKKAVAAITMHVVSTTGEKREVRVWKGFGGVGLFWGFWKAGSFWEDEDLIGGSLKEDGGRNCGGGWERKEREGDKGKDGRL